MGKPKRRRIIVGSGRIQIALRAESIGRGRANYGALLHLRFRNRQHGQLFLVRFVSVDTALRNGRGNLPGYALALLMSRI
jgi:hypothetical protein